MGKRIVDKNYVTLYNDVIHILKMMDDKINKEFNHCYLDEKTGVSTRGEWTKKGNKNCRFNRFRDSCYINPYIPVRRRIF